MLRKALIPLMLCLTLAVSGCAGLSSQVDLAQVASSAGLDNVTTGDGTHEEYQATGHHKSMDIGIAVGIPFFMKIMEVYPNRTNEDLLTEVAQEAKSNGANGMINVNPANEQYTGFPFFIIGLYVDSACGTGIDHR